MSLWIGSRSNSTAKSPQTAKTTAAQKTVTNRATSRSGRGARSLILRLGLGVLLLPLVHELEVALLDPAAAGGDREAQPDRDLASDERGDDDERLREQQAERRHGAARHGEEQ